MFKALAAFFSSFFAKAKSDPVSTGKGLVSLAAAGAVAYGTYTGVIPAVIGVPAIGKYTADGLHAIGSDTTANSVTALAASAPAALDLASQIKAIKGEHDDAAATVARIAPLLPLLTGLQQAIPITGPMGAPGQAGGAGANGGAQGPAGLGFQPPPAV